MREKLSQVEHKCFGIILNDTGAGRPPTEAEIVRKAERSRAGVQSALKNLVERGLIYQAHERGAYLPKMLADGTPVTVIVAIGRMEPGPFITKPVQVLDGE